MLDFSKRIPRKNTYAIKWDKTEFVFGYKDLLPLWVADMDFKAPEAVCQTLMERAEHGAFGYTDYHNEPFQQAVINWYQQSQGLSLLPAEIFHTPGVVAGINAAIQAFSQKKDGILIQPPVYYPFEKSILNNGRIPHYNFLKRKDGGYEIDFEDLDERLKDPTVKMMIFCNPHNPIGRVWPFEDVKRVASLCMKHQVLLLSDEIHGDLALYGHQHTPLWKACPEAKENSIIFAAPSKTFNLAGLQLAHAFIANEKIQNQFQARIETNGVSHPNFFAVPATISAYTEGRPWLSAAKAHFEAQFDFLEALLKTHLPKTQFQKPEGTYLGWMDFSAYLQDEDLQTLALRDGKVALNDGCTFGQGGENHLRINVATDRDTLEEAVLRLKKAFTPNK